MSDPRLYAWARPAEPAGFSALGHFDHTWISTYEMKVDPDRQPNPPAGWQPPESYWYSWGAAHDVARAGLGSAPCDLDVACAIAPSNVLALPANAPLGTPSKTSGTIDFYGLDGVCHNVANQVLYATGTSEQEPLRVHASRGYPTATFLFGNYGLNLSGWNQRVQSVAPHVKAPADDFLGFMHKSVPEDKQTKLLGIRLAAQAGIIGIRAQAEKELFDYDSELEAVVVSALLGVVALVGLGVFEELFPGLDPKDSSWLKPTCPAPDGGPG